MLNALTLFRVCLVIAILSFALSLHYAHRIFAEPIEVQLSAFDRFEAPLLLPARLLTTAILPRSYTDIHWGGSPPTNIGWVTGGTLVVTSTIFWTSFAAGTFVLMRRVRDGQRI